MSTANSQGKCQGIAHCLESGHFIPKQNLWDTGAGFLQVECPDC